MEQENILISIIVASYNYGRYLRDNLNALKQQTYKNIEVVIVDDGSTDNSMDIINEYVKSDSRFNIVTHLNHENKGLNESLKLALQNCHGEFVAFCESDDYWTENHVEEFVNYIKKYKDVDLLVCDFLPFGQNAKQVLHYTVDKGLLNLYKHLRRIRKPKNIFWETYLDSWVFPTFSIVMVKKTELEKCDFDAPQRCGTDIWLWRQLMLSAKTGYIDEKLTFFRRSGESLVVEDANCSSKLYFKKICQLINKKVQETPLPFMFQPKKRKLYKKVKREVNKTANEEI